MLEEVQVLHVGAHLSKHWWGCMYIFESFLFFVLLMEKRTKINMTMTNIGELCIFFIQHPIEHPLLRRTKETASALTLFLVMAPTISGQTMPDSVPTPLDMPMRMLAYRGAMSRWLTLKPNEKTDHQSPWCLNNAHLNSAELWFTWNGETREAHSQHQESDGNALGVREANHQQEGGLHPKPWAKPEAGVRNMSWLNAECSLNCKLISLLKCCWTNS